MMFEKINHRNRYIPRIYKGFKDFVMNRRGLLKNALTNYTIILLNLYTTEYPKTPYLYIHTPSKIPYTSYSVSTALFITFFETYKTFEIFRKFWDVSKQTREHHKGTPFFRSCLLRQHYFKHYQKSYEKD